MDAVAGWLVTPSHTAQWVPAACHYSRPQEQQALVWSLPERAFAKAVVLFVVDHSAATVSECAHAVAVGRLSDCHLSVVHGPAAGTHTASGLEAVGGVMLLRMLLAARCVTLPVPTVCAQTAKHS